MHTSVGEGPESWWDIYYSMKYDVNNCLTDPHISGVTCFNVISDRKSFLFLKLTSHVKVVMKLEDHMILSSFSNICMMQF